MTEALQAPPHAALIEAFERFVASRPEGEPGAIRELRQEAIERFAEIGFPTTKLEEWRFTNVSKIAERPWKPATGPGPVTREEVEKHFLATGSRLVFIDGFFSPELSHVANLPEGVVVGNLEEALSATPERVIEHLGQHVDFEDHAFAALNTAFFTDGVFVDLPKGAVVEQPVQLLYYSSGAEPDRACFPRTLVVAAETSQCSLVETYAGKGAGALTCAVTELVAGASAYVEHYKVQKESRGAFHMASHQIYLERAANVYSNAVSTGGALVRNDVGAVLDGEGAECTLNGLYVLKDDQFLDNHMRVDHAKPHCDSYELFKGILDDSSRAVFNGRIFVAEDAQKTDAKQSSRNLLLSDKAMVNANPQLEIFADDVKCTHGSTVGQLDEDAVFYLRSRGIGEEAAKSLLTYAFASDIIERIKFADVRSELEEFLFERLPRGEVVRQAV